MALPFPNPSPFIPPKQNPPTYSKPPTSSDVPAGTANVGGQVYNVYKAPDGSTFLGGVANVSGGYSGGGVEGYKITPPATSGMSLAEIQARTITGEQLKQATEHLQAGNISSRQKDINTITQAVANTLGISATSVTPVQFARYSGQVISEAYNRTSEQAQSQPIQLYEKQIDTFTSKQGVSVPVTSVYAVEQQGFSTPKGVEFKPYERTATPEEATYYRQRTHVEQASTQKLPFYKPALDTATEEYNKLNKNLREISTEPIVSTIKSKTGIDITSIEGLNVFTSSYLGIGTEGIKFKPSYDVQAGIGALLLKDVYENPLKNVVLLGAGYGIGGAIEGTLGLVSKLPAGRYIAGGLRTGIIGASGYSLVVNDMPRILASKNPAEFAGNLGVLTKDVFLFGYGYNKGAKLPANIVDYVKSLEPSIKVYKTGSIVPQGKVTDAQVLKSLGEYAKNPILDKPIRIVDKNIERDYGLLGNKPDITDKQVLKSLREIQKEKPLYPLDITEKYIELKELLIEGVARRNVKFFDMLSNQNQEFIKAQLRLEMKINPQKFIPEIRQQAIKNIPEEPNKNVIRLDIAEEEMPEAVKISLRKFKRKPEDIVKELTQPTQPKSFTIRRVEEEFKPQPKTTGARTQQILLEKPVEKELMKVINIEKVLQKSKQAQGLLERNDLSSLYNLKQLYNQIRVPLLYSEKAQTEAQQSKTIQAQSEAQAEKQISKQINKQLSSLQSQSKLVSQFAEVQLYKQVQKYAQASRYRTPSRYDELYEYPRLEAPAKLGKGEKRRRFLRNVPTYNVSIKTRGKFIPRYTNVFRGQGIKLGEYKTQRSLQRTFRLEKSGMTKEMFEADIPITKDVQVFREYRIKQGRKIATPSQFIKKTKMSWKTPEEKSLLKQARAFKMPSVNLSRKRKR